MNPARVRLSDRAQVTIPEAICELAEIGPGSAVKLVVPAEGIIELHPIGRRDNDDTSDSTE